MQKYKIIKSDQEIALIRESARILAQVRQKVKQAIKPGVSLLELDAIAYKETLRLGAKPAFLGYSGFQHTICASVNEQLIHGIPSQRILQDGDLLSIDMGVDYKGYKSDSAFSISVGQETAENKKLIQAAEDAFYAAINAIKPGATTKDLSKAIYSVIKRNGFFATTDFSGHGIGKNLHEDPNIFNYPIESKGFVLKNNMVICIEPMVTQKSSKVKVLKDGWTVVAVSGLKSSHYEHTVLIKDGKAEILSADLD
ncbi:type I methionyl aminopeptidase [Mycoplasma procyoni]|uniref:type I methionyl aminopeptidase n=1 Tax=Mycoplasma procyoni TaxID=568784 RepID=UPI00197B1800|nr:type I methionyl aminopeptidase [Mycoplasma procyoni]MBN3534976.1 type I methionyl aminopeptidase [Mycoplasma procyoni]